MSPSCHLCRSDINASVISSVDYKATKQYNTQCCTFQHKLCQCTNNMLWGGGEYTALRNPVIFNKK